MDRRTFLASMLASPVATAATEKPKSKEYSDLEKELLLILADMVGQNCSPIEDVYETGWIGIHKEAMMTLVEHGMMAEVSDGYGRGYWATFTPRTPWGTPQIWGII